MQKYAIVLLLLGILLLATLPATAQENPTVIAVGDTVTDTVTNSSVNYTLILSSGDVVIMTATSDDFDTFLRVSFNGEEIASDDDSAGALNSRIVLLAVEDGEYIITVESFGGNATGTYTLSVIARALEPIAISDRVAGNLADQTNYEIVLQAEQCIVVQLVATDDTLDPYLQISDSTGNILATDDDGGEAFNSWLPFCADDASSFVISPSSYSGSLMGSYRLLVDEQTPFTFTQANGEIHEGQYSGELTAESPIATFSIDLVADQTIQISLQSDDFDAYLEIKDANGLIDFNDDDGIERNALLVYTASNSGQFEIVATSLSRTDGGAYELRVSEAVAPEKPIPNFGETIARGTINIGDTINDEAVAANIYELVLEAETALTIALDSNDFDAFLAVLNSQGSLVAEDDDNGDGLNSLITRVLPAGQYQIVVTSLYGAPRGLYTLTVAEQQ